MAIDISQFYPVFFEETKEHLAEMEQLLLQLSITNPDYNQMNAIFRAAHSIKGGSATFGFDDIAAVTHVLESLLDKLRKKELALQAEMIDVFLHAADVIKEQLRCHIAGTLSDPAPAAAISNKLLLLATNTGTTPQATLPAKIAAAEADDGFGFFDDDDSFGLFDVAKKDAITDDDFGFFEPIEPVVTKAKPNAAVKSKASIKDKVIAKVSAAKAVATTKPILKTDKSPASRVLEAPQPIPSVHERRSVERVEAESTTIRVDVDKVDKLINLVGELVITEAMLSQGLSNAPPALLQALSTSLAQLERNTRDLQEAVMSIRMMPISFVFSRFPRMVRDLTQKLNKEVELITIGEDTELDKGLIERIADPLTHLIRNSLDHGIELPAARIKAGKPAKGSIILSASHQGGGILIEVSDDGAGLNRQRILSKAIERGLPASNEMTDAEMWDLIFAPGFSTAEVVTDVSGRGVGMDVVKRNISEMGGEVSIDSQAGIGSKITIRLPLTLAILEGMSVALGQNLYIIPLNLILETMQPKPEELKTVTGEGALVKVHGEYIPIIALHSIFNMPTEVTNPCDGILVLIEAQGKKAALFVDALVGQQQVVIKSIETNFRKVVGVSGATIMGDGSVALIIDVAAIIKLGQFKNNHKTSSQKTSPQKSSSITL